MLVLTRKENEVIKIGKDIRITVAEIQGAKVRIGIEAPQTTVIIREELESKPNKKDVFSVQKRLS